MDRTNITITRWKPEQKEPIFLRLTSIMDEKDISNIARMFCCEGTVEVRWQYGHDKKHQGDGRYVTWLSTKTV